ncbi:hypothetical protein BDQ17DRAFT_1367710 [Cyathus striatus]|nr:hypothetical protein BDQ17DRAFT_1367710 [Cyathus striatus]
MTNKILGNTETKLSNTAAEEIDAPLTPRDIRQAIRDLKPGKSPGLDGIPNKFFDITSIHSMKAGCALYTKKKDKTDIANNRIASTLQNLMSEVTKNKGRD